MHKVARVLHVSYTTCRLFTYYSLRNFTLSYVYVNKKCMHMENNQTQPESLREMSIATCKAGHMPHPQLLPNIRLDSTFTRLLQDKSCGVEGLVHTHFLLCFSSRLGSGGVSSVRVSAEADQETCLL